ncbi:hypothetical protein [Winslowiella iniecta]|uniref:Uncharacterized protein n=1 Tax=Winslowiella iniecta TaxID=1560201 RepID=A0A0L7SZN7_9GAMM|nr:hypothetical protein [Winslowiella iniecta]KOC87509.1 hypothetical protein NG42_20110 [Winslowiella iniecta]KOC88421.1 hypothetical protein NG43_20180 [Winslowiella iniecta]
MARDFPAVTSSSAASTCSATVTTNTATSGVMSKIIGASQSPARLGQLPEMPQHLRTDRAAEQLTQLNLLGQFQQYEQFVRFQHFQRFQQVQQLEKLALIQQLQSEVAQIKQAPLPSAVAETMQHDMQGSASCLQHLSPEAAIRQNARKEVVRWCNKYWWMSAGCNRQGRVRQLLLAPDKPDNLKPSEVHKALSLIDSDAPCARSVEYAFHEKPTEADPELVNWIQTNLSDSGSIEFQLLTLLKRKDAPADLTPKKLRTALLTFDPDSIFGKSTIHKAFAANKIVLSPQLRTWVNQHWPESKDIPVREKIELLLALPNRPADLNARTLYIALFYLLGEGVPGLATVYQIYNSRGTTGAVEQLKMLKECWEYTKGSVVERLVTLLNQPNMQQWRDVQKLHTALRSLYNQNAPLKNQIRIAVTEVTGGVSDALRNWVVRNWTVSSENSQEEKSRKINALMENPAMPQPVNASMVYSALVLADSRPPAKESVITAFNHYFPESSNKDDLLQVSQDIDAHLLKLQQSPASAHSNEILDWLNQPVAGQNARELSASPDTTTPDIITPQPLTEIMQDASIAEMYQQLVQACGFDILEQSGPKPSPFLTDVQPRKRSVSSPELAATVIKRPRQL